MYFQRFMTIFKCSNIQNRQVKFAYRLYNNSSLNPQTNKVSIVLSSFNEGFVALFFFLTYIILSLTTNSAGV